MSREGSLWNGGFVSTPIDATEGTVTVVSFLARDGQPLPAP